MSREQSGFSLVEILLVIVLLVLLLGGAMAGIRTATKGVERGEALIDRTNKLRVAQEFLRRQISQALYLPIHTDTTTGERTIFAGESDSVTWVSVMPGYLGHGGAYVQNLKFERADGGLQLVFRHALLNGYKEEDSPLDEAEPVVLLENIDDALIEYRALDDEGKLDDWQEDWDKPGRAPLLVRMRVEFARDTNMRWPALVIPILLDPGAGQSGLEPQFFTGGGTR
ncbi:MAG TPA: prepilin-type N-terminal cleavage/methylation domain-containing protein [Xanthomonadales bacterium]|nr:prepilin-type N-terminal cleavage/methylation domain-containing protein [Xanthomonadales bacterium]